MAVVKPAEIRGLRELQRELRRADPEFGKRLQRIMKELAEGAAKDARANVYSRVNAVASTAFPNHRPGRKSTAGLSKVRSSIKAAASGREARLRGGGARVPTFMGFEFGGSRGLGGRPTTSRTGRITSGGRAQRALVRLRTRQFPNHKGTQGYFFYPAVREHIESAAEDWEELFDRIMGEEAG